jgi:sugar/nucleoside kinase (ribokinase family)
MITDRGAAQQLHPEFLRGWMFPAGSRLHLPAYSLLESPLADSALLAVDLCRRAGGSVGVDTSSVGPLRAYGRERFLALLERVGPDLLFANDAEATFLSGTHDAEAGSALLRRYARAVIWKLGAGGAAARDDTFVRGEAIGVPVVDTTGAGDAFAAAFTVATARDLPLADALCVANRLAASVVQHMGAHPANVIDTSWSISYTGLRGPSAGSNTPA